MGSVTQLRLISCGHISVKEVAKRYGVSKSSIYELIRSDPTFPYKNVGLKKRIVIDPEEFELWLVKRTKAEKEEAFSLRTASDLLRKRQK